MEPLVWVWVGPDQRFQVQDDTAKGLQALISFPLSVLTKDLGHIWLGYYVSSQMTVTADELIFHEICATYEIETILGRLLLIQF